MRLGTSGLGTSGLARPGGVLRVAADSQAYRLRSASDATWQGGFVYGRRPGFWEHVVTGLRAVWRLILPVLALLSAFAGVYLYLDTPVPLFARHGEWFTVGHLILPLGFFAVHLTNRRYGPAYAFAQVVAACAAGVAFVLFAGADLKALLPLDRVPDMRTGIAFGIAFFAASFAAIVAFDGARGPRWWTAPFFAAMVSAVVFATLFYPAAYLGVSVDWADHMLAHAGVLLAQGVALLLPYWMLRATVPPLPGFGGY